MSPKTLKKGGEKTLECCKIQKDFTTSDWLHCMNLWQTTKGNWYLSIFKYMMIPNVSYWNQSGFTLVVMMVCYNFNLQMSNIYQPHIKHSYFPKHDGVSSKKAEFRACLVKHILAKLNLLCKRSTKLSLWICDWMCYLCVWWK